MFHIQDYINTNLYYNTHLISLLIEFDKISVVYCLAPQIKFNLYQNSKGYKGL